MALKIEKGILPPPPKVVIYGVEGIGKTTLASRFPAPLFLDAEEGSGRLDVARVKLAAWADLKLAVRELYGDIQGFRTIVIDSADWVENALIEALCADKGVDSLSSLAWGKGYVLLLDAWSHLLDDLARLQRKYGCAVVFTAHAEPRRDKQPGEGEGYDHWALALEKKTAPLLKQWSDFLLFYKYNVSTVTDSNGKVTPTGGQRVVCTTHTLYYDAKARAALPPVVKMDAAGWELLRKAIYEGAPEPPKPEAEAKPEPKAEAKPKPEPKAEAKPEPKAEPSRGAGVEPPTVCAPKAKPMSEISPAHNRLLDAMVAQGISTAEMQAVASAKGAYPAGTPLENWSVTFVERVLANFEQIVNWTRAKRQSA